MDESEACQECVLLQQFPDACLSEMLRLPHFLDSWLTDGGEGVSQTHRLSFTPQEDSWYSFLLEAAESTPGP
jgi:hypothetical protein